MTSKNQKRSEARKNAEAIKAQRKAVRIAKGTAPESRAKGKSLVPQSKAKRK